MAKAYSLDFRQKVFGAWQAGEGSQEAVAARFKVSRSFVRDLAALFRATGSVRARPRGGGRSSPLHEVACQEAIVAAVAAQNDATIQEHRESLAAAGYSLSRSALGRALLALELTHKKRPSKTTRRPPSA